MDGVEWMAILLTVMFWLPLLIYVGRWWWARVRSLVDLIDAAYGYVKNWKAENVEK